MTSTGNVRLALGCTGRSGMYGQADEHESIATIHAALDRGITVIDTGVRHGPQRDAHRALRGRPREAVQLSVKFGAMRGPDASWNGFDARPAAVRNFLATR